ncbi:Site-specific recombinase XerD [Neorhodopirellula lusitana]|uniref:Site-specific recombinase XerD n=1 Tax=Neorhodopirellula lusitana TaxID=445327 RepID=A0ABY1QAW4_9BACT|nr:Site-specific recombinase XerD [Neorhodopirellula lusitana]
MASLYKRSTAKGSPWYCSYTETLPGGRKRKVRVSTGTPDKASAQQILTKLQSDAAVRSHGLVDLLADRIGKESSKPIAEHLRAFKDKLTASGRSEDHIDRTANHVTEFVAFSGCVSVADFTADRGNRWAASLIQGGMAGRTIHARLTSLKAFSKWLVEHDKLIRDPFTSIRKPNPNADRKRERRMLLPDEWSWLMRAVHSIEDVKGCDSQNRQLLYRTAVQTGLRSNELRSLRRGSFHLGDASPYVKVESRSTKNKQVARQYVDESLADDLRKHLAAKTPKAPAFTLPSEYDMADMLRADLATARALWLRDSKDADERAEREETLFLTPDNEAGETLDFHALRHTCGAWLAMRGVQPKIIQTVMRHCSITLTLDTYGHLIAGAEAEAVVANADMTAIPGILAATGTNGACVPFVSQQNASRCVPGAKGCDDKPATIRLASDHNQQETPQNTGLNAASCGVVRRDANTQGGTRTRKAVFGRGILNPLCLPIPPPGQVP